MQPRFAALLFVLGLCDLVYVNLGLGPEVFASGPDPETSSSPPPRRAPPAPSADTPPAEVANVAPPPRPSNEPSGGALENQLSPPSTSADVAPAPGPNGAAPVAGPGDSPNDSSLSGAAPGAPGTKEPARPVVPLELASEPAARAAVEAGRAGDTELTQLTADLTVAFPDTASALLTRAAREELLTLAARLRERPTYRLRLVGHADARGTREFNKYLGGRRARAVFELLTAAGVGPEQLELESRGEDEPKATGTSEEVLAANRRVEIRIASERSETP